MKKQFTVIIKQNGEAKELFSTIRSIRKQTVSNHTVQILVLQPGKKISFGKIQGEWITVLQSGQKWAEKSFEEVERISKRYGNNIAFIMQGKPEAEYEYVDVCSKALLIYQDNPGKYFIHKSNMEQILLIANAQETADWKSGLLQLFMTDTLMVSTNALESFTKYKYEDARPYFLEGIFVVYKRMSMEGSCGHKNLARQIAWMIQLSGVLKNEPDSILSEAEMDIFHTRVRETLLKIDDYAIYNGFSSGIMRRYAFQEKYGKEEFANQLENRKGVFYFHNLKICDMNRMQADKGIPLKYDFSLEKEKCTVFGGTIFCNLPMEKTKFFLNDEVGQYELWLDEPTDRVQKCAGKIIRQEYKFHCDVPKGQQWEQYEIMCIYNDRDKVMLNR